MNTETGVDPATLLGPELTDAEERAMLDREVRANFNMSLAEFESHWRAGDFRDNEDPRITSVGMLLR